MKTKRKSENLCFTVCDAILCFLMLLVSLNDVVDGGMSNDNQKILSRRRRYLTFPEGSSFQVVYETYQPIPDYGNLLIFYLTQALAWELPSKAYHPEEHLHEIWDDVVFPNDDYDEGLVNSQVEDAAAINLQNSIQEKNSADRNGNLNSTQDPLQKQSQPAAISQNQYSYQYQQTPLIQNQNQQAATPQNQYPYQYQQNPPIQDQNQQAIPLQNYNQQVQPLQNRNGQQPISSNNYFTNKYSPSVPDNNPYYSNRQKPQKVSGFMEPLTKTITNKMDYYLSYADKVLNQVTNYATEKQNPWKKTDWYTESKPHDYNNYEESEASRKNYAFAQSRHFIHPAFGKRSTDKNLTPEEAFNLKHHRTSRQTLYQRIAKFLDTDEINGAECVLKSLCETGKRKDLDTKPGPFLMEILRVIFSLPETNQKEAHPVYSQYDDAHTTSKDCDELFPKCKPNLWNKDAIL